MIENGHADNLLTKNVSREGMKSLNRHRNT